MTYYIRKGAECGFVVPYGDWCNSAPCTRKHGHKDEHVAVFKTFSGQDVFARCPAETNRSADNEQASIR